MSAYEYIATENHSAAREIMNHIGETVDILARHPTAGRTNKRAHADAIRILCISGDHRGKARHRVFIFPDASPEVLRVEVKIIL